MQNNSLEIIKQKCESCTRCKLHETRNNIVFGVGNKNADIMFIGEAPGKTEDLLSTPFVGRSGKLLDTYISEVGLSREDIYISNILKCRPPNNRDPLISESELCREYLEEEILAVDPKIVVCVGRISAMRLIDPKIKITEEHGKWSEIKGRLYTSVFHPSLLLRNPHYKPFMSEDMKIIKDKLDLITTSITK